MAVLERRIDADENTLPVPDESFTVHDVVLVDEELMRVLGAGPTRVSRGYAGTPAAVHEEGAAVVRSYNVEGRE